MEPFCGVHAQQPGKVIVVFFFRCEGCKWHQLLCTLGLVHYNDLSLFFDPLSFSFFSFILYLWQIWNRTFQYQLSDIWRWLESLQKKCLKDRDKNKSIKNDKKKEKKKQTKSESTTDTPKGACEWVIVAPRSTVSRLSWGTCTFTNDDAQILQLLVSPHLLTKHCYQIYHTSMKHTFHMVGS